MPRRRRSHDGSRRVRRGRRTPRFGQRLWLYRRGLGVAALGGLAVVAALGFGTQSLRPVGVAFIALGIGAILLVEAAARGIRVTRRLSREVVHAGDPVRVTMTMTGPAVTTRAVHLVDWAFATGVPGGAPERRGPVTRRGRDVTQDISVMALPRGEHMLAIPGVSLADPFGLVRVRRATRAHQAVLVLPRTVPIRLPFWEADGARRPGDVNGAVRGRYELAGVRDYEPGDPLSIIHWGQTARRGSLQTKELHGGSGRTAGVLIAFDTRTGGDRHEFETAVSAAASLAEGCVAHGSAVGLMDGLGASEPIEPEHDASAVVRRLAVVAPEGRTGLADSLARTLREGDGTRLVVTVTSVPDPALGPTATQLQARGVPVACVLVGRATADLGDLTARGIVVTHVPGPDLLEAALNAGVARGRY